VQILRINKIKNYRIYQNWHQPNNTDFARFNVIYGGNGSGKSTLASLLVELADGDWSSGTSLSVKDDDDQNPRDIKNPDEAFATRLCIFNADYVEKNLRFDSGETESLLYLGKESIDNQKRREELEEAIDEANNSTIPQLDKQLKNATKKRDDIGTTGAAKVSKKLQGVDDRYNGRRYTRKQFRSALDKALQLPPQSMADFDLDQQIKRIASPATERITKVPSLNIPLPEAVTQVSDVLAQTVTSQAIEELKNNHEAASWVQAGIQLHRAGDRCLFCEGVYTEERVNRLNRHFDESLRRVQQTIDTLDAQIVRYEEQCQQFTNNLEPPKSLDEVRTKRWVDHANSMRGDVSVIEKYLAFLRQELTRKRENLFHPLRLDEMNAENIPSVDIDTAPLSTIINEHNSDIDNYEELKNKICDDVVQYYIEDVRTEYTATVDDIQRLQDSLATATQKRDDNTEDLQRLKNSQQDRVHYAQLLTTDLHRYFGRDELTFGLSDNGGYLIQRNGEKAVHLSEGEQRSIALLYFLRDIESNGAKLRERIVVFDDPVSSVDDGAATGAFAYIWDKCIGKEQDGVGQLIVLTHNFDFFRRWVNRLDGLKRLEKTKKNLISYDTWELRTNTVSDPSDEKTRVPYFVRWDEPWKYALLRSEYHYLFWRAATELEKWHNVTCGVLNEYDAAILPNVCRRLLEGFLSFRCPKKIGHFEGQMKDMLDNLEDSAKRNYLVRFLHEYSHNEQCDPNKHIQLLETPKIIESIFSVIQEIDEPHYTAMCDALEVSPLPSVADNAACK